MKRRSIPRFICILMGVALCLSACGSKNNTAPASDSGTVSESISESTTDTPSKETGEKKADTIKPAVLSFSEIADNTDAMLKEAVLQYETGDYTPLEKPVEYYVLWLGFTHVTYEDLDFQMTDSDREYLETVALNFEKSVETITGHNIDITVNLHFVDETYPLTKADGDEWLYLAQDTVQPVIDKYTKTEEADTVLTTVQTAGDENHERNAQKDGYGTHYVMLGLETAGLSSDRGYSTFDLGIPKEGTYPLADPEIPSLYATAVAVHEWMHQLEYLGTLLNIEYPNTHAYWGPDSFPGYEAYTADKNDYDYFEFYKLVLQGKLPYTGDGSTRYVGMYPKMWPLIKRDLFNLGTFTIQANDKSGYLTGQTAEPTLTLSDDACQWIIRYGGNRHFTLTPKDQPDKLIDLSNAWDVEDNAIGLWVYTGYVDAQSWYLVENTDGTVSIQTPYESGRLLTLPGEDLSAALCTRGAGGIQNWIIECVSWNRPH